MRRSRPQVWSQETILLPEQFTSPRRGTHEAVRRLMVAILEDAIVTFHRHRFARSMHERRLFREAREWLMDDGDASLRCVDVCSVLDLDPDFLRRLVRQWPVGVGVEGDESS